MSRFEDRIEQGFDRFADRVAPSPTAWEAFRTRIADETDRPETEIIMLSDQTSYSNHQPRRWMLAAAAFLLVALAAGLLLTGTFTDEDAPAVEPTPTDPSDPDPAATTSTSTTTTTTTTTNTTTNTTASTSSSLDPAEAAWQETPTMLFSGVTGEFRTNTFGVPFKFNTGDMPHSKDWEREDWIAISNDEVPGWIDVFTGLDSIDATIEEFQDMHDTVESAQMDEPEPAALGGAEGVVFQSVGLPAGVALTEQDRYEFTAPITDRGVWANSSAYGVATPSVSSPGSDGVSIWVIDVNGQIVVVAQSALDMQMTEDVHARSREATRSLIESIEWKDLS